MSNLQTVSNDLVNSLELQYEPVGVVLYMEADSLPPDIPFTD